MLKNEVISKTIEIIDNISAVRIILCMPGDGFWPDFAKKAKKVKNIQELASSFAVSMDLIDRNSSQ